MPIGRRNCSCALRLRQDLLSRDGWRHLPLRRAGRQMNFRRVGRRDARWAHRNILTVAHVQLAARNIHAGCRNIRRPAANRHRTATTATTKLCVISTPARNDGGSSASRITHASVRDHAARVHAGHLPWHGLRLGLHSGTAFGRRCGDRRNKTVALDRKSHRRSVDQNIHFFLAGMNFDQFQHAVLGRFFGQRKIGDWFTRSFWNGRKKSRSVRAGVRKTGNFDNGHFDYRRGRRRDDRSWIQPENVAVNNDVVRIGIIGRCRSGWIGGFSGFGWSGRFRHRLVFGCDGGFCRGRSLGAGQCNRFGRRARNWDRRGRGFAHRLRPDGRSRGGIIVRRDASMALTNEQSAPQHPHPCHFEFHSC